MREVTSIDPEILGNLQSLVVDNPDLEKLEGLLDQFNIFESLGAVRQELRHSDFLAFLLNPNQNHGLGDVFAKRLLQKAITQAEFSLPITPIDLDLWDLDDIEIRREWQSIDILILDESHQLAVVIENKLYNGEHDNQLERYWQAVHQHRPGYRIIGLYLTPEGEEPSSKKYIPIGYDLICNLVEALVETRASTLGKDVLMILSHYGQMLRRHIVGESEIERLCQQIYRRHQRALDLIFEYRPDRLTEIKEYLCELIEEHPDFELDHTSKSYICFIPKKWDVSKLREGQGWTRSGRMLLFQFSNLEDSLKFSLVLGPGPEATRLELFDWICQNEPPFKRAFKALGKMWSTVYMRTILTKAAYEEKDTEEIKEEIRRRWNEFLDHEFPKMDEAFVSDSHFGSGK